MAHKCSKVNSIKCQWGWNISYSISIKDSTDVSMRVMKAHLHESGSLHISLDLSLQFIFKCIHHYTATKIEIDQVTTYGVGVGKHIGCRGVWKMPQEEENTQML